MVAVYVGRVTCINCSFVAQSRKKINTKGPPTFSVYYQFFEYVNDKLPRGLILSINTTYLAFLSTGLILSIFYD